jgi:SPX domain protein involved in polyphosphate accumulation
VKREKYGRYELKYFLPQNRIEELLQWAQPYILPDKHAITLDSGLPYYNIQSVYFDSPDLALYFEKLDGLRDRRKFRIRAYCRPGDDTVVFIEIKYRYNTQVMKDRAPVMLETVEHLLKGRIQLAGIDAPAVIKKRAERFLYYYRLRNLRPMVTVKYDRNPYIGREDSQIRLTVDTNLVAIDHRASSKLFEPYLEEPVFLPGAILELKFDRLMPDWMRQLIQRFDIRQQSISKYAYCIDAVVFNKYESM